MTLRRFARWIQGTTKRPKAQRNYLMNARPRVEALEDRRLMAAPVAADDFYSVDENQTLYVDMPEDTSLSLRSESGDWVGQGLEYDYEDGSGEFFAHAVYEGAISVHYGSESD